MNYTKALEYTHSLSRYGWILGLGRLKILLENLNNPQKHLKFIHVAGTNGKGTTSAFCANILTESGFKTGLYISPAVLCFTERFQIDGKFISENEYARIASKVAIITEKLSKEKIIITEFEFITAVAFCYFKENNCDYICLETGLGGQYDATNIIDPENAHINIITSISLDHISILGDTIEKITEEKAAIIKSGGKVVNYPVQKPEATAVIAQRCAECNAVLHTPSLSTLEILSSTIYGTKFMYADCEFTIKLAGEHQVYNAITAYTAMKLLNISDKMIVSGLAKTTFPARFEVFEDTLKLDRLGNCAVQGRRPPLYEDTAREDNEAMCSFRGGLIIVDCAHNFDAMQLLAKNLRNYNISPEVLILGMLEDKNYIQAAACIVPLCKNVILTNVPSERMIPPLKLAGYIEHSNVLIVPDNKEAINIARDTALKSNNENPVVLITGSLYLAGNMRRFL